MQNNIIAFFIQLIYGHHGKPNRFLPNNNLVKGFQNRAVAWWPGVSCLLSHVVASVRVQCLTVRQLMHQSRGGPKLPMSHTGEDEMRFCSL